MCLSYSLSQCIWHRFVSIPCCCCSNASCPPSGAPVARKLAGWLHVNLLGGNSPGRLTAPCGSAQSTTVHHNHPKFEGGKVVPAAVIPPQAHRSSTLHSCKENKTKQSKQSTTGTLGFYGWRHGAKKIYGQEIERTRVVRSAMSTSYISASQAPEASSHSRHGSQSMFYSKTPS